MLSAASAISEKIKNTSIKKTMRSIFHSPRMSAAPIEYTKKTETSDKMIELMNRIKFHIISNSVPSSARA